MTQDQAHELLLSYGFNCFKSNLCWYYSFDGKKCIFLFTIDNIISFSDFVVYRSLNDEFLLGIGTHGSIFFRSNLEEIDEDYLKMEIEEYLLKYKNKLVELQKLELDKEFS